MLCDDSSLTGLSTSLVFRCFVFHRMNRQVKPTVLQARLEEVPNAVWTRVYQHQVPHTATAHSCKSHTLSNTQVHQSPGKQGCTTPQILEWLKWPIRGGK